MNQSSRRETSGIQRMIDDVRDDPTPQIGDSPANTRETVRPVHGLPKPGVVSPRALSARAIILWVFNPRRRSRLMTRRASLARRA
jgi:hypothetical protein